MATISKEINHSNIFEKISDFLKFNDAFEISSTLFNCLESDAQRVFVVYSILNSSLLLPAIKIKEEKLESKAEHWRNEGNAAFMKKQDINAIKWYTQSIGYAIPKNKEMSLALANRSAVTFALGEYSQSIRDIDAALNGKYPDHLKYKLYERKGKCFQKLNLEASAKKYFEIAAKWISNSSLNESKQESIRRNIEREISNCTNKDYSLEKKDSIIPNVSYPNPEILSASSSIKIEYDACIGRHLRASQDILPGDVLVVEQPYASILLPNDYLLYCNHCLMRCHCMIPCTTCTLVFYCSEFCKEKSWEASHKIECIILNSLLSFGLNKIELLSLRTLLVLINTSSLAIVINQFSEIENYNDLRTKGFSSIGQYDSSDYRSVHHLVGNTELRSNCDLFRRSVIAACILHYLILSRQFFPEDCEKIKVPFIKSVELPFLFNLKTPLSDVKVFVGGLILRYLQSFPSNAHEVTEMVINRNGSKNVYDSHEMGSAVYPVLSLCNHSCDPNVVRHNYDGDTVVLRAIQAISKGDQICDSYGYHYAVHGIKMRQTNLSQQYYFKCQCVACVENWPIYTELPSNHPVYKESSLQARVENSSEIFKKVLSDVVEGNMEGKLEFLFNHLALLHKAVKRPWKEYSECQETIKQCLSFQGNHYIILKE